MRRLAKELDRGQRPWLGGWYLLVPILALAIAREWWAPDEPRYGDKLDPLRERLRAAGIAVE